MKLAGKKIFDIKNRTEQFDNKFDYIIMGVCVFLFISLKFSSTIVTHKIN